LSQTGTPVEEQLRHELVNNPDLVKSAKQRILEELDAALEKRGIGPVCTNFELFVCSSLKFVLKFFLMLLFCFVYNVQKKHLFFAAVESELAFIS